MASSSAGRSILRMIIKNFIESLTPKKRRGDFVGTDNLGNKYYEIPAAWLRGRRTSPPVMENLFQYMKIMKKIQVNSLKKYPEIKVNTFISLLISCTCPILVGKSKSVLLLDFQLLNLVPASNNLCLIIEECFQ
ncbi:uncharacterized protein LOC143244886 isoform X3 [Tachypleus tridentatus]|uniref:uncharacterized protein LOC143244886 isoform X3 n=1 Tax=Tachypleus tridentatus TaxID=6853 RepID=UPI003FD61C6C